MPLALAAALLLPFHLAGQTMQAPVAEGLRRRAQASESAPLGAEAQAQLEELQGALKSAVAARDARTAARILNHIGELWLGVGNPQNALEAYNRALAAAKLAQDAEQGVTALNGQGNVARNQGQTQEALQAYQRALEVATSQGVAGGKADALNGLALTYASIKPPDKALDAALQALAIRRSLGDPRRERPRSWRRLRLATTRPEIARRRWNMRSRR